MGKVTGPSLCLTVSTSSGPPCKRSQQTAQILKFLDHPPRRLATAGVRRSVVELGSGQITYEDPGRLGFKARKGLEFRVEGPCGKKRSGFQCALKSRRNAG